MLLGATACFVVVEVRERQPRVRSPGPPVVNAGIEKGPVWLQTDGRLFQALMVVYGHETHARSNLCGFKPVQH